jgi:hypothetical protein
MDDNGLVDASGTSKSSVSSPTFAPLGPSADRPSGGCARLEFNASADDRHHRLELVEPLVGHAKVIPVQHDQIRIPGAARQIMNAIARATNLALSITIAAGTGSRRAGIGLTFFGVTVPLLPGRVKPG